MDIWDINSIKVTHMGHMMFYCMAISRRLIYTVLVFIDFICGMSNAKIWLSALFSSLPSLHSLSVDFRSVGRTFRASFSFVVFTGEANAREASVWSRTDERTKRLTIYSRYCYCFHAKLLWWPKTNRGRSSSKPLNSLVVLCVWLTLI